MTRTPAPRRYGLGVLIALNSVVQVLGLIAGAAVSFITVAAIARELGPSVFGHYAVAIAFLAIPVALADGGFSTHVLREISRVPERTEGVIRAAMSVRIATSVIVVCGAVATAQFIPLDDDTRRAILIGAVGAILTLLGLSVLPVLMAQLRMGWAVVSNVSGRAVTLTVTLLAISRGGGLDAVLWAYVAGAAVTLVINLAVVSRLVSIRPAADVAYWKRLVVESIPLGVAHGFGQIYYRIDTVILAALRPVREAGLYAAAFKFIELTQVVVNSLMNSIFPSLSRFAAVGDPRLRPLVQRVFEVLLCVSLPLSIIAATNARALIVLVGGEAFADGALALQILAAYPVLSFLTSFVERGIIVAGRDRVLAIWTAGFLLMNISANLVLIPAFGYAGAAAAAVGTEFVGLFVGASIFLRVLGFLPRLGGIGVIVASAAVMTAVIVLVPGPALPVTALAVALYAALLLLVPGSIRDLAAELLNSLRRGQLASSR